jgi:hypothetical protein
MASNACAKCRARPAYWHSPTLSYLCSSCTQAYRARFHVELRQALEDDHPRLTWGARLQLGALVVVAAAFAWLVLVLILGLEP